MQRFSSRQAFLRSSSPTPCASLGKRAVGKILLAMAATSLGLGLPLSVRAQTGPACQFVLGFKSLHDLDPTDIGDCLDNQTFTANGDAQQHTTKGLMAWRNADNWTGFTDGYRTWINGPLGLVARLNTQRYSWEPDFGAPGLTPISSCQPMASSQSSRTFQRPPAPCL